MFYSKNNGDAIILAKEFDVFEGLFARTHAAIYLPQRIAKQVPIGLVVCQDLRDPAYNLSMGFDGRWVKSGEGERVILIIEE